MYKVIKNTVFLCHDYLRKHLKPGNIAIDATVGNGKDTLFLAGLVGRKGLVYGFDIQENAIANTRELLLTNGYSNNIKLFLAGHENMDLYIRDQVDAIIFNLGFLPGGDKKTKTLPEKTVMAVDKGINLLNSGGIICIVIYAGHEGGSEEQELLEEYVQNLDKKTYRAVKLYLLNRKQAPFLILIEKNT
jgi:ribosomal protein L11 methylase PrmA